MHREFAAIESSIETFIEQPDDSTLLLRMSDNDVVPVLKMFQSLDERVGDAIFLCFPFACDEIHTYVNQCMESLGRQIDEESASRIALGEAPWPSLPMLCLDPRREPFQRLREALGHVRALAPDGTKVVWAWLPSSLGDGGGFSAMALQLLALDGFEHWMEGHRFCVRDDAARPFLIPLARERRAQHVLTLSVDFSSESASRDLADLANDEAQPIVQRMGALLQIAAIDLAQGRLPEAQRKYRALYAFHADRNDSTRAALALHGLGDVASRRGSQPDAKTWYLRALPAALDGDNLLAVINSLMAIGDCCNALKEHANAAAYFDIASGAAGRLLLVDSKIVAMEKAGVAMLACGKTAEAAKRWIDAKGLCEQFACARLHRSIVDRLVSLYAKAGLKAEARAFALERERFRAPRGHDTQAGHAKVLR